MITRITIAATVLLVAGPGVAHAQSAEAEALFSEADRLFAAGKLAEACATFEGSNRIEPRAGTLIRLGECREATHQTASAWSAYKDAITRAKDPRKLQLACAKAAELEVRLSYLTISVSDEARVDGLVITRNGAVIDPVLLNRAVPVDGGTYTIGGHAPGVEEWTTAVSVPLESAKISVEVPKFKELAKLAASPAVAPPTPAPPPPAIIVRAAPASTWTARRELAIGAGGAAVVSGVIGAVLELEARGRHADAFRLCPDPAAPCVNAAAATAAASSAHRWSLGADVALSVAGLATIGAGVLWLTGGPEHAIAIAPAVGAGEAGATVSGRF